jgi:hypothetical protein
VPAGKTQQGRVPCEVIPVRKSLPRCGRARGFSGGAASARAEISALKAGDAEKEPSASVHCGPITPTEALANGGITPQSFAGRAQRFLEPRRTRAG